MMSLLQTVKKQSSNGCEQVSCQSILNHEVNEKIDQPLKKYLENLSSSEFYSLRLESITNNNIMEKERETKDASGALSSLYRKETELARKYLQQLDKSDRAEASDSPSLAKDVEPELFLEKQTKFFDHLKRFLTSQQIALKQNLILLETKTSTMNDRQAQLVEAGSKVEKTPTHEESMRLAQENIELEALHQWGNPDSKNDLQICPVCGMEFEIENAGGLEDHVVAHWCSSQTM